MGNLVRMSAGDYILAAALDSTDIARRAQEIHGMSPTATAALGRCLSMASLMGSTLKAENGSVTLQFKGNGPGGTVIAVSDAEGNVRGYLQYPQTDIPRRADGHLDVGGFIGSDGYLTVIKDFGMKEPYVGTVGLIGGEVAEDVAAYYAESEQIPTACAAGVLIGPGGKVSASGAYLLQLMPGYDEALAEQLEKAVIAAGPVTAMLDRGMAPEEILRTLLGGFETVLLESRTVEYRCYCSRERVTRALVSAGRAELEAMLSEQHGAEVTCQFCDRIYTFGENDLRELIETI